MPILFTPIQPILGILLLDPAFLSSFCSTNLSMHLTLWKFQCIALELKLLWKRWFTRAFHNLKHFGSFYTIFTWIWTYKNHDLTDHQLAIGSFLLAIASMGREQQILSLRWPSYFPLCPPLARTVSFTLFFCKASSLFVLQFVLFESRHWDPLSLDICSVAVQHAPSSILPSCALPGQPVLSFIRPTWILLQRSLLMPWGGICTVCKSGHPIALDSLFSSLNIRSVNFAMYFLHSGSESSWRTWITQRKKK